MADYIFTVEMSANMESSLGTTNFTVYLLSESHKDKMSKWKFSFFYANIGSGTFMPK
jgi:hypothetical protein